MTEELENLILEHLRAIRADIVTLGSKIDSLTVRVGSLEEHVAGLRRERPFATMSRRVSAG